MDPRPDPAYAPTVEISKAAEGTFEHGDAARFTGEVWLRSTLTADDGTNYGVGGRGRVRTRGEAGHVLEPTDGSPEWGDPVTDEEYGEGF
jgi:hypothetical protein